MTKSGAGTRLDRPLQQPGRFILSGHVDNKFSRPSDAALVDAQLAVRMLGARAMRLMPPAATVQFGEWLGWPDWLKAGTSMAPGPGIPDRISVADDLICIANIIDHGCGFFILERLFTEPRIAGAPVVGPALYNAPTVLDALQLFQRSLAVGSPFIKSDLIVERDRFSITIGGDFDPGPILNFACLASLLMANRFIGTFLPNAPSQTQLWLRDDPTAALGQFLSIVPGTFHLSADRYALLGDANWLAMQNVHTDQAFWAFSLERMSAIEREGSQSEVVERIRSAICITMEAERRVPRLKQIAAKEGVSERTLVRNLAQQGTSFHQIVEAERRRRAAELIGSSNISLGEVATALGFTDMSSFGRSFRKWFGVTPGQARNRRIA